MSYNRTHVLSGLLGRAFPGNSHFARPFGCLAWISILAVKPLDNFRMGLLALVLPPKKIVDGQGVCSMLKCSIMELSVIIHNVSCWFLATLKESIM